mgnify:CR=1 FL=1
MTSLKFVDKREYTVPTFGDLEIGDLFTSVNGEMPFIKTAVIYDKHQDSYNTVSIDGEFYWSDDEEEITPIQEIEITLKK